MKQLQKGPLLQALLIMTLVLLTYQKDSASSSKGKQKKPGGKRCKDCIQVRATLPKNPTMSEHGTRDFKDRAIVRFDYRIIPNPGGFPENIMEVVCLGACRALDMDMNVIPINRSITYLQKEKNVFVLKEKTVTVGCTCAFADIMEQPGN